MAAALLVGMIRQHVQRISAALNRGEAAYRDGWTVKQIPARHRQPEISETEVAATLTAAVAYGGAHVIGVSKQDGEVRKRVARAVRPYFRFRWLDNTLLSYLGPNVRDFIEAINQILAEEEMWASHVQPTAVTSPLLLPKSCFETERPFSSLWELAEQFGDPTMIPATERMAQQFEQQYWHGKAGTGSRWTDHAHRIFDHTGARHGIAQPPRGWKYSFAIPEGFHYDVTTVHGRAFSLLDPAGLERSAANGGHLNVDPHGYIQ